MNFGMRLHFCSGGGGHSAEREWLGSNMPTGPVYSNTPATNVKAGTCFQTEWRAHNSATANKTFRGRLQWQTS